MWTCPKCGNHVDPSFEICWACGTSADGVEDPNFVTADEAEAIYDAPSKFEKLSESALEQDLPEPPPAIVECYRARDEAEAKFLVDQLASLGIPAFIEGSNMGGTEFPVSLFAPRVMIRSVDLARARAFVEDFDRRKKVRHSLVD